MSVKGDERRAWLRFACVPNLPISVLLGLLQEFELPEAVFDASPRLLSKMIGEPWAGALTSRQTQERVERCERWLDATTHAGLITLADADYPSLLVQAGVAPGVLFYRGNRRLLSNKLLGVVGTDAPDQEGADNAWNFARATASRGVAVVGTLMPGVGQWGLQAALGTTGGAIGVAPCGIDRCYPVAQKTLYQQVAAKGLIVSPFAPGEEYTEQTRQRQSELLVGMVGSLLVVQSRLFDVESRMAQMAAEWGRDVYVIPGSIHSPLYKGNHRLIRQGAKLVESVDEMFEK